MRRPVLPATIVAAALFAAPAPAAAKEIGRALACGKAGCVDVTKRLPKGDGEAEQLFGTGSLGAGRPEPHPYLVMRLKMGIPGRNLGTWKFVLVPALGMVRYPVEGGQFHWGTLAPDEAAAIRRIVRGVPRWPASRMPRDPVPTAKPDTVSAAIPPARTATTPAGRSPLFALAAGALAAAALALAVVRRRLRGRRSGW
jgi:hypothetical protein